MLETIKYNELSYRFGFDNSYTTSLKTCDDRIYVIKMLAKKGYEVIHFCLDGMIVKKEL